MNRSNQIIVHCRAIMSALRRHHLTLMFLSFHTAGIIRAMGVQR